MAELLGGRYRILREIGEGGTGVIFLAEDLNLLKLVVLKRLKVSAKDISLDRNEVDLLKDLHHTNLPQVYDFLNINNDLYTVVEFIQGNDLTFLCGSGRAVIPEEQLRDWLLQLCDVLDYLHTRTPAIIHSDIKPGNMMITPEGRLMLIDFGISFAIGQNVKGYSNWYASPEQVKYVNAVLTNRLEEAPVIDGRSDLYSLAASFYHILSGIVPSVDVQPQPLTTMGLPYSTELLEILDRAMQQDPSKRFKSARKMFEAIQKYVAGDRQRMKILWEQLAVTVVGLVLVVAGVFCMTAGQQKQVKDSYESTYRAMVEATETHDTAKMLSTGQELAYSGKYEKLRHANDSVTAEAFAVIGEAYYEQGSYVVASGYFQSALDLRADADFALRYIISLVRGGAEAQSYDAVSRYSYLLSESGKMTVSAEQAVSRGDYAGCIGLVDSMGGEATESLYETGAYAAQKLGRWEKAADYFEKCFHLTGLQYYLRLEGEALYMAGVVSEDAAAREDAFSRSLSCYRRMNSLAMTDETLLWEGVLQYQLKDYSGAVQTLTRVTGQTSDSSVLYQAYIYLALATYDSNPGQNVQISQYCTMAAQHYNKTDSSVRLDRSSDLIQTLERLMQMYSVASVLS